VETKIPVPPVPGTTLPYAQKIFPFMDRFGMGTFGQGMLAGKTMYFAFREAESQIKAAGNEFPDLTDVTRFVAGHVLNLLEEELASEGQTSDDLPEMDENGDPCVVGFQCVGYRDDRATTSVVKVGQDIYIKFYDKPGCTATQTSSVVQAIRAIYYDDSRQSPPYQVFSLQDAIEYAEFLIGSTAAHQKFSRTLPSVGGEIDIALVTPFDNFTWIRQKQLSKMLTGRQ
jgi:hypothetical protein